MAKEEILERMEKKLGVIIKLLASGPIEGKTQSESILTLGALGLDRNLIAEIVGASPQVVSSRLSEAKKKKAGKPKSKKTVKEERSR